MSLHPCLADALAAVCSAGSSCRLMFFGGLFASCPEGPPSPAAGASPGRAVGAPDGGRIKPPLEQKFVSGYYHVLQGEKGLHR